MLDGPDSDPRVAWVKHTTFDDYVAERPDSGLSKVREYVPGVLAMNLWLFAGC